MDRNNPPYYSLSDYLKTKFHTKVAKISLDAGFTCPNRDGKIGYGGCIFCSGRGSGDFAPPPTLSITEQLEKGKNQISQKWGNPLYIAYFQAFTNTYAPVEILRKKYMEALQFPHVVGLAIATRPDCLEKPILELLEELSKKTFLWVELGLQSSKESTARLIHRGYDNSCFENAVTALSKRAIETVVHIILGLPYETQKDMLESCRYAASLPIQGIKLQLLHVLKNTPLETLYQTGSFPLLSKEEYMDILCQIIAVLPPNLVIHRLTGDGSKESLIGPLWSLNKRDVLNSLQKTLKNREIYQGKFYQQYEI